MSCTYGKSDVFRLVEPEDVNTGKIPGAVRHVAELFPIVGKEGCFSDYAALSLRMRQDISYERLREDFGYEFPVFILLCHMHELDVADLHIYEYYKEFVEVRDISMGLPLATNYFLYITDPKAVGMSDYITEEELLNSPMRNAARVTYIRKEL